MSFALFEVPFCQSLSSNPIFDVVAIDGSKFVFERKSVCVCFATYYLTWAACLTQSIRSFNRSDLTVAKCKSHPQFCCGHNQAPHYRQIIFDFGFTSKFRQNCHTPMRHRCGERYGYVNADAVIFFLLRQCVHSSDYAHPSCSASSWPSSI